MSNMIYIKNLDGTSSSFNKDILDDPTHMFHDMCKEAYERAKQTLYPVDFNTFTILSDEEVESGIVEITNDRDISRLLDCMNWVRNQNKSYNEGDQIQNIILDRKDPNADINLCGCLGPNRALGYSLCPCDQTRALYKYRYNLYKHFKDSGNVLG